MNGEVTQAGYLGTYQSTASVKLEAQGIQDWPWKRFWNHIYRYARNFQQFLFNDDMYDHDAYGIYGDVLGTWSFADLVAAKMGTE